MSEVWVPQNERQHPPFEPGNEVGLRHGCYSPRRIEPLAEELLGHLLADESVAYLRAPKWRLALLALARTESRIQLLSEYLMRRGEESGDGVGDLDSERVRSAYALLHRCETRAATLRARLGLDPLSASRLGRDHAAAELDVARLFAQMEERERQEAADGE